MPIKNSNQFHFLLNKKIDLIEFWHQPPSKIKSLLGKPDQIKYGHQKVDFLTYYSTYQYDSLDLKLTLTGQRKKKHRIVTNIKVCLSKIDSSYSKVYFTEMYGKPRFNKINSFIYYFEYPKIRVDMFFDEEYLRSIEINEY